jgi:hypothetical protein
MDDDIRNAAIPELRKNMNPSCRRYLVEQVFLAFVVNAFLNALGPWLFFGYLKMTSIPMHGPASIVGEVIGTSFVLPLLICLTLTLETHRRMKHGLQRGHEPLEESKITMGRSFRIALPRSLKVGALGILVLVPTIIGPLLLVGFTEVDVTTYCVIKAIAAGVLAAVIAPPIALRALGDQSRK